MKKKQLFAVLLAGSMTVGMAPAAAFAAEDTGAVTEAEATTADENTETPDDGAAVDDQSQSEADAQAEAEAQAAAQAQAHHQEGAPDLPELRRAHGFVGLVRVVHRLAAHRHRVNATRRGVHGLLELTRSEAGRPSYT